MNNRWVTSNNNNLKECLKLFIRDDLTKLVIDGKEAQTKISFMEQIEKALHFPTTCAGDFAVFEDLIRDLCWLPKEKGICIWITNYEEFMQEDLRSKGVFEKIFNDEVFSFWETEVVKYVKGGTPRDFYVIVSR